MKKQVTCAWLMCISMQLHAQQPLMATKLDEPLGLYRMHQFEQSQGAHVDDQRILPQALWYFRDATIATPKADQTVATYTDNKNKIASLSASDDPKALPSVVWIGSNYVFAQAQIDVSGLQLMPLQAKKVNAEAPLSEVISFSVIPKIASNLSYWNTDTLQFFKQRQVRMRGELSNEGFIARTVWPLDYRLDLAAQMQPLSGEETLKTLVQAEQGGAQSAYQSRLLWARSPKGQADTTGKSVLALMLNGAQGDDDEAHGGHFAVVTGRMQEDGSYAHWLVNNYYDLATSNEKGIIAGITPLDNYLADLNSGQSYYRPSYMLVAVFKSERLPQQFQAMTHRIFNHFYRHDMVYDHSRNNCAGISIDTLRAMGWNVPTRGVEGQLKAITAYFYSLATARSLHKARALYDYYLTEATRLFPAVAFDAIGEFMLSASQGLLSKQAAPSLGALHLQQDIEAIYFVRIPQIPSSRAFGLAPVYSIQQYLQQAPADRSQWKVVPTAPNPLPQTLKTGLASQMQAPSVLPWPVLLALVSLLVLVVRAVTTLWATFFRGRLRVKSR